MAKPAVVFECIRALSLDGDDVLFYSRGVDGNGVCIFDGNFSCKAVMYHRLLSYLQAHDNRVEMSALLSGESADMFFFTE